MRRRVLVLFPQEWDHLALSRPAMRERFEFVFAGFDLFRFPDNVRLLTFDARRFIDRLAKLAARRRIDAVSTTNEQFGALIAAVLAQRLGLPGNDPHAVVRSQHKYYARQAIERALPQACPPYTVFPYTVRQPEQVGLPFPFFVKPVKATFSVLARRVDDFDALRAHLRFKPFERHIIERLIRPFDDLLAQLGGYGIDAHHLIGEGLMAGLQVNVDGYVCEGEVRVLGIVDEVMYPGTTAFNRFEYPSSLPLPVQERIRATARRAIEAVGYTRGFFNVEMIYGPATDQLRVVEINPRMASQFADLYGWVDGLSLYDIELALALGEVPRCEPAAQRHAHAGSFIFRKFDGKPVHPAPSRARLRAVRERHPEAHLMLYLKRGADLAREMKWLGSHRFGVLNVAGTDLADLYERYREIRDTLGFEQICGPEPAPLWPGTVAPAPAARR